MSAQILPFPSGPTGLASPAACFIRIGEAHRKLADLHAASRFPARRVVVEASRVRHQSELLNALREAGAEIVLDTEAAELAAPAKFGGHSRFAPWALPLEQGRLGPEHFKKGARSDVIGKIARFAVTQKMHTVLAPSHFLGDPGYGEWLTDDQRTCLFLREALDREGGAGIAIDYLIILSHTELNNPNTRGVLATALADLPIDTIWIRASGLDSAAGPLTVRRYFIALSALHSLGKPIVADHLGGLVGSAALAFGAASAVAHGIGERERFNAVGWHKEPQPRDDETPFGRTVRIGIPAISRSATVKELKVLASAKGGRRLVGCGDPACCAHGFPDMIDDPRRHAAHQTFQTIARLESVPDLKREHHFLNGPMTEACRRARQIKSLKPSATDAAEQGVDLTGLMQRLDQHSRKLEQLQATLERLHESRTDETSRARPIGPRTALGQSVREERR